MCCYPSILCSATISWRPTPSFTIALTGKSPHVCCKFVRGNVVANPLPAVPLVLFVPEAAILQHFWVRLAPCKLFAMRARVGWMAGVAALTSTVASALAAKSVVAFVTVRSRLLLCLRWAEELLSDWTAEAQSVLLVLDAPCC